MISDNDNINYYQIAKTLEIAEKNFKDMEYHLKSGGEPVTASDISNTESSVLGVSLKSASESMKGLSNNLSTLYGKVKKGGK